jgi:uncharacterized protein YfdQ (DUF2303 family)
MSLTKDALQHIQDLALAASANPVSVDGCADVVALPESVQLANLERFKLGRDRFRGMLKTHAIPDFTRYVERQAVGSGAAGFIDQDAMSATVIFNLGGPSSAGHGDDTATLTLKPTAAYSAVLAIVGRKLSQQELAEWMEDWAPHIQAMAGDEKLPIAQAINGIRKMTLKATSQRDSAVGDFSASRSAMDEIEAKSQDVLASALCFTTVPFEGLQPATLSLRLSVLTSSETPVLKLRWVGEETQREEFAREFQGVLEREVGGLVPLTLGTFNLGK